MILFRKRFKKKVVDIIQELREEQDAKKSKKKVDRNSIYVLDIDKIDNLHTISKVIRLLDNNGMTFILDEKEVTHFKDILKKKYDNK